MAEKVITLPEAFTINRGLTLEETKTVGPGIFFGPISISNNEASGIIKSYLLNKDLTGGQEIIFQEFFSILPPGVIYSRTILNGYPSDWAKIGSI